MLNESIENLISGAETELSFDDLERSCFVDLSLEMPKPEILLSIGEHLFKGHYYPTSIWTASEFSAIVAVSKSKKSFLKSALIGAYIGGDANILFPNIKTHRDDDYGIVDFDTEQGAYYTQRTFRRVNEIAGGLYKNYRGYATRHLSSSDRLRLIDGFIKNQEQYFDKPLKLVSIDGIADLVENTNDIVMSKEASDYVMRWTHDYNLHVTTVIHKAPATNKPLGHLGTYVLKKAETVIDLTVNEDKTITVTNPYSRGYGFESFTFDINKDALPYLIDGIF